MFKKLRISLIFSNLVVIKTLNSNHRMHNLYANFVRILEVCKRFSVQRPRGHRSELDRGDHGL